MIAHLEHDTMTALKQIKAGQLKHNHQTLTTVNTLVLAATSFFVHDVNWTQDVTEDDFWNWFHQTWPKMTIEVSRGQDKQISEVRFFELGQRKNLASARLLFNDKKKDQLKKEVKSEINRLLNFILDETDFTFNGDLRPIGSRFDHMYDRAELSALDTDSRPNQRLVTRAVVLNLLNFLDTRKENSKAEKWSNLLT